MTKEEKIKAIADLTHQQKEFKRVIHKISRLKKTKRFSVAFARAAKVVNAAMEIRMLEAQKHIIIAQPIPKYPSGRATIINSQAIVGQSVAEASEFAIYSNLPKHTRVIPISKQFAAALATFKTSEVKDEVMYVDKTGLKEAIVTLSNLPKLSTKPPYKSTFGIEFKEDDSTTQ